METYINIAIIFFLISIPIILAQGFKFVANIVNNNINDYESNIEFINIKNNIIAVNSIICITPEINNKIEIKITDGTIFNIDCKSKEEQSSIINLISDKMNTYKIFNV